MSTYDPKLSWEENCRRAAKVETNFPTLHVVSDTPEYISPITGKLIDGKVARKEDLKRSGCVPFEPMTSRPRGIASPKRAAKLGRKWDEAAAHRQRTKRIDPLSV